MKIRIQGNSVRYRLSRTEVEKLAKEGYLKEQTSFGPTSFTYIVKSDPEVASLSASYLNGSITLSVPATFAVDWADNNVVGFDNQMPLNEFDSLYLLIEKDFKCLDNVSEDQSDNYENPNKTC
ncbi:DUF7009 family protein [Dyadobacter sp. CY323]|uniref:DUF7009 family protein n=1 Tax=Dyadobacter sp. CY323 TaxID=2907302 RepID=UPI001F48C84D|nr:hypothetical protein [Dyadobacter sp. CY323]MCE6989257.1 hypothetical protein [Dyadobacter sp. CY323]